MPNSVGCAGRHDAGDGKWESRSYTPGLGTLSVPQASGWDVPWMSVNCMGPDRQQSPVTGQMWDRGPECGFGKPRGGVGQRRGSVSAASAQQACFPVLRGVL